MENESVEQVALESMSKSEYAEESWESFTSSLAEREDEFDIEIEQFEKLDLEAKSKAIVFYVR